MQLKWQVPNNVRNLQIESKLIQVIQWKDKGKGKRSIWSETTILIEVADLSLALQSKVPEDEPGSNEATSEGQP